MSDSPRALCVRCQYLEAEIQSHKARLQTLVEASPIGIFFDDAEDHCVFVNHAFCRMTGLSSEKAMGDGWTASVSPEDLPRLLRERALAVQKKEGVFCCEYRVVRPDGATCWVEEQTRPVRDATGELLGYVGTLVDISAHKEIERSLRRHHQELESRVRERTAELEEQTARLQEMNAALKVVLRQRAQDRQELEQDVLANARRRIFPCLDRLENVIHGEEARALTLELRRQLEELTSPFCHRMVSACQGLTPAEMRVAEYIREGLGTKDIALRLGVGTATIDSHRHQIRRKLGLSKKKINLRSYLQSLST